jgi:lipopolysaccharide transport system ATP-binding protein
LASAARAAVHRIQKLFSRNGQKRPPEDTQIWALKDVSFDVARGDVVNHWSQRRGKSTLLKILSRITSPPRGRRKFAGVSVRYSKWERVSIPN